MKKLLSYISLLITYILLSLCSYAVSLFGVCSQGKAFMYLVGIYIFYISMKIVIGNLTNDYENSKLLIILLMVSIYLTIWLISYYATMLVDVKPEDAFKLICLGISLGRIGKETSTIYEEKSNWLKIRNSN